MIAGRAAPATKDAARATSSASGATPATPASGRAPPGPFSPAATWAAPVANITSIGKSTNTGPRWGVSATAAAPLTTLAASDGSVTVVATLVTEDTIGTWSI